MALRTLLTLTLGLISNLSLASSDLTISEPWVRATPPGKMMTAAYASIENEGSKSVTVVGVSAAVAGHTSLHETRIERDRSTMRPVMRLTIDAGERVSLQPGGLHIMLMKLNEALNEGQSIDICFELENNDTVCSVFSVAKHRSPAHRH